MNAPRQGGHGKGNGRGSRRAAPRTWQERLDDPDEPLFTIAIAADLLGLDTQSLRRLEAAAGRASTRPSGNQRRYSRADLELLSRAADLARGGTPAASLGRILDLERQVADLQVANVSVRRRTRRA